MVFTYMRGAVIPISFSKVFLPPYHRDVDIQYPRFAVFIKVFSGYWWTWISNMAQLINYGREMLRINTQKNTIEYSTDSGRNWHSRYSSSSAGIFYDLFQLGKEILACTSKGIYYSTDEGRNWHSRYTSSSAGTFQQLSADGRNLLATTSKGLYYSTDEGRNWHKR